MPIVSSGPCARTSTSADATETEAEGEAVAGNGSPMTTAWDRRPDETDRAWAAFSCYLSMSPSERSFDAVARKLFPATSGDIRRRNPGQFTVWSRRHEWKTRAAAYDSHALAEAFAATAETRKRLAVDVFGALSEAVAILRFRIPRMSDDTLIRCAVSLRGHLDSLATAALPDASPSTIEIRFRDDDEPKNS
jgi:hypothetical protein